MSALAVTYRTHPDAGNENERLVREVFRELDARDPGGIRYAAFRMADGVGFLHVATFDDAAANPLPGLPAFIAFQADLAARCASPPSAVQATLIGAYRFAG